MSASVNQQQLPPIVLIADDQPSNRAILRRYVESAGYRAIEAENGSLALDMIDATPPDALLLDIFMPVLDGFGVLRALRSRVNRPYIPVIVVTAAAEMVVRQQAYHEGADDFLLKPVDSATLRARLRAAIRLKQVMEQMEAERRRFEFIASLSRDLIQIPTLNQMLDHVVTTSTAIIHGTHSNLFLVKPNNIIEILTTNENVRHRLERVRYVMQNGAAGYVARTQEPLLIDDVEASEHWLKLDNPSVAIRSAVMVPIADGDGLLGILAVYHSDVGHFTQNDQDYLELVARQIVGPIRQSMLLTQQHELTEKLSVQTRQLQLINSLAQALNADLDLQQLYKTMDYQLHQLIGDVAIGWYTINGDDIKLNYASGIVEVPQTPDSNTLQLIQEVRRQAKTIFVPLTDAPSSPIMDQLIKQGYESCLALPLAHQDTVFGVLITTLRGRAMTSEECDLLEMARPHLAVALTNAQQLADQEARHREQNELRHLRNMEELAGSMAHHFNNLFAVILGNTQLAELDAVNEDQQLLLSTVVDQVRDGAAMIKRLHWLKGNERVIPSFGLDLNESLPAVLESLEKTDRLPIVRLELEPNLHALIYERELFMLCKELITNGIESGSNPDAMVIKGTRVQHMVHLEFIDAGQGVNPEDMHNIWRPFWSTERHQRLGLGLSICSALLWRIGGSMDIRSNAPKAGMTVQVDLPIDHEALGDIEEQAPVEPTKKRKSK